jgi:inner membrane protein
MAEPQTTSTGLGARVRRALVLSPVTLAIAALVLAAADWGYRLAGDSFVRGGPLDEIAHLMTALLILWALGPRICKRFMIPALIASVAIDADHIPGQLGATWLTAGTPRPYTHSLLTIVVVLAIAALWRARRDVVLGVAIGLALHFFRDLAEGDAGVSLLWPVSYHSFQYPHGVYVAIMIVVVTIDAARCAGVDRSIERRLSRQTGRLRSGHLANTPEEA